jgi:hypothetical protein
MVSGTWRSGWHEREQFPIVVTDHTIDRLRSRAPTMRFPDEVTVRLEVAATLREGCVSTRSPAWLGRDYRRRTRRTRDAATIRYVWTADEARPYVLRFERSHDHGRHAWAVLTTLTPGLSSIGTVLRGLDGGAFAFLVADLEAFALPGGSRYRGRPDARGRRLLGARLSGGAQDRPARLECLSATHGGCPGLSVGPSGRRSARRLTCPPREETGGLPEGRPRFAVRIDAVTRGPSSAG